MKNVRLHLMISSDRLATLRAMSSETGAPIAFIVRRAIDEYISLKAQHTRKPEK